MLILLLKTGQNGYAVNAREWSSAPKKLYACDGKGEQLQGMPLTYCMM